MSIKKQDVIDYFDKMDLNLLKMKESLRCLYQINGFIPEHELGLEVDEEEQNHAVSVRVYLYAFYKDAGVLFSFYGGFRKIGNRYFLTDFEVMGKSYSSLDEVCSAVFIPLTHFLKRLQQSKYLVYYQEGKHSCCDLIQDLPSKPLVSITRYYPLWDKNLETIIHGEDNQ